MRSLPRGLAIAGAALALLAGPVSSAAAAASSAAGRHGGERFMVSTRTPSARRDHLRATGVLTGTGYAIPSPLTSGHGTIKMQFARGSVLLAIDVTSSSVTPPNFRTCGFSETYLGTYQVRIGRRAYAGATGYGHFSTKITGRLTRSDGQCLSTIASFSKFTLTWGSLDW